MPIILDGTNGETFPTWTTATRPASPSVAQVGWNTTIGSLENYNGTAWTAVGGGGAGSWQAVQTGSFAAVAGNAYAINTTSAAITVTLPASPTAGAYIQLVDYAGTWGTNNVTVNPNGLKINASTSNVVLSTNRQGVAIVYIDSTQGWICYSQGASIGPYSINYLVVAGGGAGANSGSNLTGTGGGGGAGGLLEGTATVSPGTSYTMTVGAGGAGITSSVSVDGNNGSSSSIVGLITTIGGGGGGQSGTNGKSGGSGGGAGAGTGTTGGSGTSGQGYAGGNTGTNGAGGGGGAGGLGSNGGNGAGSSSGNGGNYYNSSISGTTVQYAGGGGGGGSSVASGGVYPGSALGGGATSGAGYQSNSASATANTGGGSGGCGAGNSTAVTTGNGGSGIIIIRYLGAQRGTGGTVTSSGGYTIHTFTTSSSYAA